MLIPCPWCGGEGPHVHDDPSGTSACGECHKKFYIVPHVGGGGFSTVRCDGRGAPLVPSDESLLPWSSLSAPLWLH